MVSITGLEFAYTQAPKKMKSVIMALFLMSVSLGNLFTAGVHKFIQVPDKLVDAKALVSTWSNADTTVADRKTQAAGKGIGYEQSDDDGFALVLKGWEESVGDDDIRVGYAPDFERVSLVTSEVAVMKEAIATIGQYWDEHDRLPFNKVGASAISHLQDPWGKPLHYALVNRRNFEITSEGPDKVFMTTNDVRALVHVDSDSIVQQNEMADEAPTGPTSSILHPTHAWIVVRKAEIDAAKARKAGDASATWEQFVAKTQAESNPVIVKQNHAFATTWQIGGATTLTGAALFEFFTWFMLGTAILFVAVGYFYVPKTYIQDDGAPADE
jgi:POT family proton-dependent oligopeptide transporter